MHEFGKFTDKNLKEFGHKAIRNAVEDCGIPQKEIQAAFVGNSVAGLITGQEGIRGQTILRAAGFTGIPIVNVENACASSSTAFRQAWLEVASGQCDVALALGVEKLYCNDTPKTVRAISADSDIQVTAGTGFQFVGLYALDLKKYMRNYNVSVEQFARVTVKNRYNGSLNPYAQFRKPVSIDEVLSSRMVADPLTLFMCAPIGDGAAAAILCSREFARMHSIKSPVRVGACVLRSGSLMEGAEPSEDSVVLASREAYQRAGVAPSDIDVAELHDAMAPAELRLYEKLGFCEKGGGGEMVENGVTEIRGDLPINTSGGLVARGHPIGATGLAQINEIVLQLRGEAGSRQVQGCEIGLAQNAGGWIDGDAAACCVTILQN